MSELDPERTVTGAQLLGAERIVRRHFTNRPDATGQDVQDMHEMAGLADGWNLAALAIARAKAEGALRSAGVDLSGESNGAIVPVRWLRTLVEGAYVHGMTIGSLAGIDVTDPEEP